MFRRYLASHSGVYGGDSRTPGSPARPVGGWTVARSNTVLPCMAHTPVQSGSAGRGLCAPAPMAAVRLKVAAAATPVRMKRTPLTEPSSLGGIIARLCPGVAPRENLPSGRAAERFLFVAEVVQDEIRAEAGHRPHAGGGGARMPRPDPLVPRGECR